MTQRTYGLTQGLGHGFAFTENVPVPNPAAGAGFTYRNASPYWQLVDSLSFKIVSSSQAANRAVTLTVADGNWVPLATIPSAAALTASKTGFYTYLAGYSATTGGTDGPFLNVFPSIFLQQDYSFTVAVAAVDTADQLSEIRLQVQQYVTGEQGYLLGVVDAEAELDAAIRFATLTG